MQDLIKRVFYYFDEICKIPHGSGNCKEIADFCVDFAEKHKLFCLRDKFDNVIIYKNGTDSLKDAPGVILQGHLDMVCQKEPDLEFDFLKDSIKTYIDGDFLKARGTTLGADNAIATAMILSILESDAVSHPPIEAVFTTDEETGMIGASALDTSVLKASRMINLDSEDLDTVTVSCAGGSDLLACFENKTCEFSGTKIKITLGGLLGGHSGVTIHEGRANANILMGRLLLSAKDYLEIISLNGGDKGNAIPKMCTAEIATSNKDKLLEIVDSFKSEILNEISTFEKGFFIEAEVLEEGKFKVLEKETKENLIYALNLSPNGVISMSHQIQNLVETSLNLGILKFEDKRIVLGYSLRSSKKTALRFLEKRLFAFYNKLNASCEISGIYPPWEYNQNSVMLSLYKEAFKSHFNKEPKVEAIHAGLECGVFADKIKNFDAISIGPQMYDVHTTDERLSVSSVESVYTILLKILANCR